MLELGGMGVKGGVRSMGSFDVWLEWWMVISPLFLWGLEGDVIHLSKNSPPQPSETHTNQLITSSGGTPRLGQSPRDRDCKIHCIWTYAIEAT